MSTEQDERKGLPSASSMDRLAHCPGSWIAEKLYSQDDDAGSSARDEGTEIHEAMEDDDMEHLEEDTKEISKRLKSMEKLAVDAWLSDNGEPEETPPMEAREKRYWLKDKDQDVCSAKLDYVCIQGSSALVIDYKSGYLDVTPSHRNYQIRTQAVTLWRSHPNIDKIRGAVASYRFREQYTQVDYTLPDLFKAEREIRFLLWRSRIAYAERVPGEWCRYCKAKANCPEAAAYALLPVPVAKNAGAITEDEAKLAVLSLSLEQLAYMETHRTLAGHVFSAITNRLRQYSEAELASVGLKFRAGREILTPKDLRGIFDTFVAQGLITKEEYSECLKLVLTRLMKRAMPKMLAQGVKTKKAAIERIKALWDPYCDRATTVKSIVKMTQQEKDTYDGKD